VCIGAGYQQGRSQPSSLVLVVRGDGGRQKSHDFGGYRIELGGLHEGCMVRPANHDHTWVFIGFDQFNTEPVAGCVDGPAGEGRGGMMGQGGLAFRLAPVECSQHSPGRPDSVGIFRPIAFVNPM
jgi:hypothetical protein